MAQTIASMMVSIGVDVSEFEEATKQMKKNVKSINSEVGAMAKEMGEKAKGFSDKWKMMSDEMKQSYQASKDALKPFKKDLLDVEYSYFKLAESMETYKGTNREFMNEVSALGARHKKVTDEMMKNNNFMKNSFIQSVGAMVNRSGQSEKIAANFERMGNPLYTVNNGLLKVGSSLEKMARQGNASVQALKMLGPTANMKELNDMTRMINQGLMRFTSIALVAAVGATVFYGALHDAAASIPGYTEAFNQMGATMRQAFQPMVEVFAAVMMKVYSFITLVGELMIKFNEAHPILAKVMQGFVLLLPAIALLLSPLAIGIGLIAGMQAALASVWVIIGPLVTGFLSIIGTVALVSAGIVAVSAALYLLWTKTDWFKNAVMTAWENIKSATKAAWNWLMDNVIQPVLNAIQSFIQDKMKQVQQFWNENGEMIMQAAQNVWNFLYDGIIKPVMMAIGAIMKVVWPVVQALVVSTWSAIKQTISGAIDVILGIIKFFAALFTGDWSALWEATKQILSGAVNALLGFLQLSFIGGMLKGIRGLASSAKSLFSGMWSKIKSLFSSGISNVHSVVSGGFNKVVSFITGLGKTFYNAGKGLIDMMRKGIENAAKSVLSAVENIAGKVRDFLPFSPAKDGPMIEENSETKKNADESVVMMKSFENVTLFKSGVLAL
jgi:phage-related protein